MELTYSKNKEPLLKQIPPSTRLLEKRQMLRNFGK